MAKNKLILKNLLLSSAIPLTLSDRRLYNYLLHNAFDKSFTKLDFMIVLTDLSGVYGAGSAPVERVKESLRRLMRTLIEFEVGAGKWAVTSFLQKAEVDESKGELYYSFPEYCRELFTDPVTLEQCLIQAHFIHKYSHFMYDILATSFFSKQFAVSLETTDLRSRLQIPENKLTNFSDLDRFALIPALKEINSYASFAVKFRTERKGMKVTHVVFEMTPKKNISLVDAKSVLPPKKAKLFIDDPDLEWAYAYLLNAETTERRKYFDMACKLAAKKHKKIHEQEFDGPDLWFRWVANEVLKKK